MKNTLSVNTSLILLFTIVTSLAVIGQGVISIPMNADYWEHDPQTTEFINHRSVQAVKGIDGASYQIGLKDHQFENGTIEFDVEFAGNGFPGILFRMSEDGKTGENFYIRSFGPVTPKIRTTLQYAPIFDGMSMWDLTDEYQAGTDIKQEGWNHVKLVISGLQMNVYVNDMETIALHVPCLESARSSGSIALNGNIILANFVIKPDQTDGLPAMAGYDPTATDPHYLNHWQVSDPIDFPFGRDLIFQLPSMYGDPVDSDLPDSSTVWKSIDAQNRSIINLSRIYGQPERGGRRLAWLKKSIHSDQDQERTLDLGFSDEVWVFINGQILHVDKNYYGTPSGKYPKSRCTIDNTSFTLPLRKGENEILIALANYFYGWGIVARLDKTDGLDF